MKILKFVSIVVVLALAVTSLFWVFDLVSFEDARELITKIVYAVLIVAVTSGLLGLIMKRRQDQ